MQRRRYHHHHHLSNSDGDVSRVTLPLRPRLGDPEPSSAVAPLAVPTVASAMAVAQSPTEDVQPNCQLGTQGQPVICKLTAKKQATVNLTSARRGVVTSTWLVHYTNIAQDQLQARRAAKCQLTNPVNNPLTHRPDL
jgi:hypothetical protein